LPSFSTVLGVPWGHLLAPFVRIPGLCCLDFFHNLRVDSLFEDVLLNGGCPVIIIKFRFREYVREAFDKLGLRCKCLPRVGGMGILRYALAFYPFIASLLVSCSFFFPYPVEIRCLHCCSDQRMVRQPVQGSLIVFHIGSGGIGEDKVDT
jgi:hypothetical protein